MVFPFFKTPKSLHYSRIIISGGYCAGKTSLLKLMEKNLGIPKLIDHSTREMRTEEQDGFPYHFISRNEFKKNISLGKYYDWVEFCGNYYGVLREEVFGQKLWSLDTLTATWLNKYKNKVPGVYGVFLQSPSYKIILKRARDRGDHVEKIRLLCAKAEKPEGFDLILPANLNLEEKLNIIIKHVIQEETE